MSKFRFKPDDFSSYKYPANERPCNAYARCANQLLDEHLAKCPVVFGKKGPSGGWVFSEKNIDNPNSTHKAILLNIEELVKEHCKHEVGRWELLFNKISGFCRHCGVKIKPATWEAAE